MVTKKIILGTSLTTVLGILIYLSTLQGVSITTSGDIKCLGTLENPCVSYFNITSNYYTLKFFNTSNQKLSFSPEVKDYKIYRFTYGKWKEINFPINMTKGVKYQFKIMGYKNNPYQNIKWNIDFGDTMIDPWWNTTFTKRNNITISGMNAPARINYPVAINITYASGMNSNFNDLRFTNDTTSVDYWIETNVSSKWAYVWINVPYLPSSPNVTISMYYGSGDTTSTQNGVATFPFFDDFNDNSLNTSKWQIYSGTITETGGNLVMAGGSELLSIQYFGTNVSRRTMWYDNVPPTSWAYHGFGDPAWANDVVITTNGMNIYDKDGTGNSGYIAFIGSLAGPVWDTYTIIRNGTITNTVYHNITKMVETNSHVSGSQIRIYDVSAQSFDWMFVRNYTFPDAQASVTSEETYTAPPVSMSLSVQMPQYIGYSTEDTTTDSNNPNSYWNNNYTLISGGYTSVISSGTITTNNNSQSNLTLGFMGNQNNTFGVIVKKTSNITSAALNLSRYMGKSGVMYNDSSGVYWYYFGFNTATYMKYINESDVFITNLTVHTGDLLPATMGIRICSDTTCAGTTYYSSTCSFEGTNAWFNCSTSAVIRKNQYLVVNWTGQVILNLTIPNLEVNTTWSDRHIPFPFYKIYTSTYNATNPYLDVGYDGVKNWNYTGEFNVARNRTFDFSSDMNTYLSSCTPNIQGYCNIPFFVHSDTSGLILVDDIQIGYSSTTANWTINPSRYGWYKFPVNNLNYFDTATLNLYQQPTLNNSYGYDCNSSYPCVTNLYYSSNQTWSGISWNTNPTWLNYIIEKKNFTSNIGWRYYSITNQLKSIYSNVTYMLRIPMQNLDLKSMNFTKSGYSSSVNAYYRPYSYTTGGGLNYNATYAYDNNSNDTTTFAQTGGDGASVGTITYNFNIGNNGSSTIFYTYNGTSGGVQLYNYITSSWDTVGTSSSTLTTGSTSLVSNYIDSIGSVSLRITSAGISTGAITRLWDTYINVYSPSSFGPYINASVTKYQMNASSCISLGSMPCYQNGSFTPKGQTNSQWIWNITNVGTINGSVNAYWSQNLPSCMKHYLSTNYTFESSVDYDVSSTNAVSITSLNTSQSQQFWGFFVLNNCTAGYWINSTLVFG